MSFGATFECPTDRGTVAGKDALLLEGEPNEEQKEGEKMNEKRYPVTVPNNGEISEHGITSYVTKVGAHLLRLACEKIEIKAETEKVESEATPVVDHTEPPWAPKVKEQVLIVCGNRRAEVLMTWGEIAWVNVDGTAATYGFDELRPFPPEPKNLLALKDDEVFGLAQLLKGSSDYASIFGKLQDTPAMKKGEMTYGNEN